MTTKKVSTFTVTNNMGLTHFQQDEIIRSIKRVMSGNTIIGDNPFIDSVSNVETEFDEEVLDAMNNHGQTDTSL